MPSIRRVTASILIVFLALFVWAGSGFACVMPAEAQSAMSGMAMRDMDMAGMEMPASGQQSGETPTHDGTPCTFPWAAAGCQSMAPCALAAITPDDQTLATSIWMSSSMARLSVLMPPSRNLRPELPPPRV